LAACERVKQVVEVIEDDRKRDFKLVNILKKYQGSNERVLVFALYKKEAQRLQENLEYKGFVCSAVHGDKSQFDRTQAVEDFRSGKVPILVATDVASRGLDIPGEAS